MLGAGSCSVCPYSAAVDYVPFSFLIDSNLSVILCHICVYTCQHACYMHIYSIIMIQYIKLRDLSLSYPCVFGSRFLFFYGRKGVVALFQVWCVVVTAILSQFSFFKLKRHCFLTWTPYEDTSKPGKDNILEQCYGIFL